MYAGSHALSCMLERVACDVPALQLDDFVAPRPALSPWPLSRGRGNEYLQYTRGLDGYSQPGQLPQQSAVIHHPHGRGWPLECGAAGVHKPVVIGVCCFSDVTYSECWLRRTTERGRIVKGFPATKGSSRAMSEDKKAIQGSLRRWLGLKRRGG